MIRNIRFGIILVSFGFLTPPARAGEKPKALPAKPPVAAVQAKQKLQTKVAGGQRAPASVTPTAIPAGPAGPTAAKIEPNHAVEIRGQSRTLSMMLVLKNGKENINFIKIRKDYNPEITGTQY